MLAPDATRGENRFPEKIMPIKSLELQSSNGILSAIENLFNPSHCHGQVPNCNTPRISGQIGRAGQRP
jgi:hypothetical protein